MDKGKFNTWLVASCYCKLNEWHRLLQQLKDLLTIIPPNLFKFYKITFHYTESGFIRFAVLTTTADLDRIGSIIDNHLTAFFSSCLRQKISISGIFLPYPTNIAEYSIDSHSFHARESLIYSHNQQFSSLMLSALVEEQITTDILSTFAFYLVMSLAKQCLARSNWDYSLLISLISEDVNNAYATGEDNHYNKMVIKEITDDILRETEDMSSFIWLEKWDNICEAIVMLPNEYTNLHLRLQYFYQTSSKLIFEHLNFTTEDQALINKLLIRALLDYSNK
jgi:hypothetical protein